MWRRTNPWEREREILLALSVVILLQIDRCFPPLLVVDRMFLMNECKYNHEGCIQLSPFFHQVINRAFLPSKINFFSRSQVGGHSSMFQYDQDTVCKVLDVVELSFYQSMPDPLKKFTPEFRGRTLGCLFRRSMSVSRNHHCTILWR